MLTKQPQRKKTDWLGNDFIQITDTALYGSIIFDNNIHLLLNSLKRDFRENPEAEGLGSSRWNIAWERSLPVCGVQGDILKFSKISPVKSLVCSFTLQSTKIEHGKTWRLTVERVGNVQNNQRLFVVNRFFSSSVFTGFPLPRILPSMCGDKRDRPFPPG